MTMGLTLSERESRTLSIVTATYNRGELLRNCFRSLMNQSSFDFEWIVIDDGSTDNTEQRLEEFCAQAPPFEIFYLRKANGGKHTALNASHRFIHGKYVLILDSDDTLLPNAVETVISGWSEFKSNKEIGIVTFLKQTPEGQILAYAENERIALDVLNHKRITNVASDCCETIRADLFLKFPFPEYSGEKFLAETALWYRVGIDSKCVYINVPIYCCEYLDGGLTKSGKALRMRNCCGGMYTSYLRMHPRCALKERVKAGILYSCYSRCAGMAVGEAFYKAKPYDLLLTLCYVPGVVLNHLWKWKYQKEKE